MADNKNDEGTLQAGPTDAERKEANNLLNRPPRRGGYRWLSALAVAALIWIVAAGAISWWALRDVPWQQISDGTLRPVVLLEDAGGEPLVQSGPFQGAHAPLEEYSDHLIDAVLAIEDRRFFEHFGIDVRGITRAFVRNVGAGQVVQGGPNGRILTISCHVTTASICSEDYG